MNTLKINTKGVKMIAHRGLSGIERENTYPAFVAAGNRSYYGIETDVHRTAAGEFIIIHNATTEEVTDGKICINVEENNFDAVKDIILPDKDGTTNRNDIRIPLLIDYIRICKKYEKTCVLELVNIFTRQEIANIIEIVRNEDYLQNMIFISAFMNNCLMVRDFLPNAKIQLISSVEIKEEQFEELKNNRIDVDIFYKFLNKELVDKYHNIGIEVNCWTCDNKADAEALVEMGVDYITTDIIE